MNETSLNRCGTDEAGNNYSKGFYLWKNIKEALFETSWVTLLSNE